MRHLKKKLQYFCLFVIFRWIFKQFLVIINFEFIVENCTGRPTIFSNDWMIFQEIHWIGQHFCKCVSFGWILKQFYSVIMNYCDEQLSF